MKIVRQNVKTLVFVPAFVCTALNAGSNPFASAEITSVIETGNGTASRVSPSEEGSTLEPSNRSVEQGALDELPEVPIGDDAYIRWHRLPYHRLGVRTYMRATHDRSGFNSDPSHFLYQEADDFNVALDTFGPGILYFVRTNHHHGSPWHYEVDGKDLIVKESATDNPVGANKRLKESHFMPTEMFPYPLVHTWPTTHGADLMWRPVMFSERFRLAYSRTYYGTGYFIYQQVGVANDHLSRDVSHSGWVPPDHRVAELLNRAGTDIGPIGDGVSTQRGTIKLGQAESQKIPCKVTGANVIRALKFALPRDKAEAFGKCRLKITWDSRAHASIDAPVDLFFATGRIPNDHPSEYLVKGLPIVVRYDKESVHLECYWPMPFYRSCLIEIESPSDWPSATIDYEVRTVPYGDLPSHTGYFHATYTDHPKPKRGRDNVFLDTQEVEGGGQWSGSFVGMSWIFTRLGHLQTLEGDPRFFFDNSRTPQACGTGTEEWGGGGDYWGGKNMSLPLAGHPVGKAAGKEANPSDLVNSAYRFLIADSFPFGCRAVIGLEHGGVNESDEHYSGVVYWYGTPAPSLLLTDTVDVCDADGISQHEYMSPTAESPYQLSSRYDLGPDHEVPPWGQSPRSENPQSRVYYAAETDKVRVMHGETQFVVRLHPGNQGVLLRRKFDYQYPNQHAKVYVRPRDAESWEFAGDWYSAGSNTCVISRPPGDIFSSAELGATEHVAFTSNRRWREDEFLISRPFTRNHAKLQIRLVWVPENRPLYPGYPYPVESGWSESKYWVYCYQLPNAPL